jgi:hypothetical protein
VPEKEPRSGQFEREGQRPAQTEILQCLSPASQTRMKPSSASACMSSSVFGAAVDDVSFPLDRHFSLELS